MASDIEDLQTLLREFARVRDWEQFHTPKNLAMALAAEAGELLEPFQWLAPDEAAAVMSGPRATDIEDEIADVAIYLLRLADVLGSPSPVPSGGRPTGTGIASLPSSFRGEPM